MEKTFCGFCRTCDQTFMVICEFTSDGNTRQLLDADCLYPDCIHAASCTISRQILDYLKESANG